jgi:hypothetical protein
MGRPTRCRRQPRLPCWHTSETVCGGRVTLAGDLTMIAPVWHCPPRVVAAAPRVAPDLRDLLKAEGRRCSHDLGTVAGLARRR